MEQAKPSQDLHYAMFIAAESYSGSLYSALGADTLADDSRPQLTLPAMMPSVPDAFFFAA